MAAQDPEGDFVQPLFSFNSHAQQTERNRDNTESRGGGTAVILVPIDNFWH